MLEEPDRRAYLKRLRAPGLDNMTRSRIVKAINEKCKKVTYCPHCKAINGKYIHKIEASWTKSGTK